MRPYRAMRRWQDYGTRREEWVTVLAFVGLAGLTYTRNDGDEAVRPPQVVAVCVNDEGEHRAVPLDALVGRTLQ